MQYTIVIRKAPDGKFIASCPAIPECHAQGDSYEECLANAKEALALCIEHMRARQIPFPEEAGSERITVAA